VTNTNLTRKSVDSVIFDVDGVLVDSIGIKGDCFIEAFRGNTTNEEAVREFHETHGGMNRKEKIRRILKDVLDMKPASELEAEIEAKFASCLAGRMSSVELMPSASYTLEHLHDGMSLFAVSAMPAGELSTVLRQKSISKYFRKSLGYPPAKDVGIASLLQEFDLNADRTLVVGDSVSDYEAAMKNSCQFVLFVRQQSQVPQFGGASAPIERISSLSHLITITNSHSKPEVPDTNG
jgi:phosphoglycolate phosphatase-like HAD superfamily hydrolase